MKETAFGELINSEKTSKNGVGNFHYFNKREIDFCKNFIESIGFGGFELSFLSAFPESNLPIRDLHPLDELITFQ